MEEAGFIESERMLINSSVYAKITFNKVLDLIESFDTEEERDIFRKKLIESIKKRLVYLERLGAEAIENENKNYQKKERFYRKIERKKKEIKRKKGRERRARRKAARMDLKRRQSLKRMKVLAALYECEKGGIEYIIRKSGLSRQGVTDAIEYFLSVGYLTLTKEGRRKYYSLTYRGTSYLQNEIIKLSQYEIKGRTSNSNRNNLIFHSDQMIGILEQAIIITRELSKLGWYHSAIKEALRLHKMEYILKVYKSIMNRKDIADKDKGKYLYAIIIKGSNHEKRIEGAAKKMLKGASPEVIKVYKEESSTMTSREYIHYANAIRARLRRAKKVCAKDALVIGGWIRKKHQKQPYKVKLDGTGCDIKLLLRALFRKSAPTR